MTQELRALEADEQVANPSAVSDLTIVQVSVILGIVYGVVSKYCKDQVEYMTLDSEVAFRPDLFFEQSRLRGWASGVGLALTGNMSFKMWNNLVLEVTLGTDSIPASQEKRKTKEHYTSSSIRNSHEDADRGMILSAQANGMTGVSQILVEPSTVGRSAMILHVRRGQILNVPITEDRLIRASDRVEMATRLVPDGKADFENLWSADRSVPDTATRIDAEPCGRLTREQSYLGFEKRRCCRKFEY